MNKMYKTQNKGKRNVLNPDVVYPKHNVHHISPWWSILCICTIILLGYISYQQLFNLPVSYRTNDASDNPGKFIGERAWRDLKILNDFGPRPVGSNANEVLAVDLLKREINFIQQNANRNQRIVSDIQTVSGAYFLGFRPFGMTNMYNNVQNVIVKLLGSDERDGLGNQTLMLNCHFDSVPGSPGASDDAASCCVMLEILRVMSKSIYTSRHTILFLFNGAEETPLQASHGFITQHEWAKDVKAFLNLESVGSGGKEILFQSGPYHPWLIKYYGKTVPYPNAQVAAEEIFQSGLIPSDTDFRIFRDFGRVPGMDFAHVMNGYRYHTKYDNIDYISFDVLQRTGDNILALTNVLSNADELANIKQHAKGVTVYYDYLGIFFVSYSKTFGNVLNLVIVVLATTFPFLSLSRSTHGIYNKFLKNEIRVGVIATLTSVLLSIGVCYGLALLQDLMDKTMTWYGNPYLILGLYCAPAIFVQAGVHVVFNKIFNSQKSPISLALKIQVQQNGTNLLWGSFVIGLTFSGFRMGYVGTVILIFTLISNFIIGFTGLQNTINKWLYVQLFFQIFIVLWGTHLFHLIINLFIPITGRSGGLKNPDIIIAVICAVMTFLTTSYLSHLVMLLKRKNIFFGFLIMIFLTTQLLIMTTSLGFPYQDDSNEAPKPQRHFITHTKRTFYDINGKIRHSDAGFWMREMDRNSRKTIESLSTPHIPVPQLENNMCEKEVFCGIPIHSCRQLTTGGYWLPATAPVIREVAQMKKISRKKLSVYKTRVELFVQGNALLSLLIRPKHGIELIKWNILPEVSEPYEFKGMKSYLVLMSHGLESRAVNITLDLKSNTPDWDGPIVDVTLVTTHWEYYREHTPSFAQLLVRVPKWAFAVPSVAALNAYTF